MRLPSALSRRPTPPDDAAAPEPDEAAAERAPRADRPPQHPRDGLKELLTVVYRISRVVFLLLALACAFGVVFVLAPTNEDNSVVQLVNDIADGAAGPFRDVFTNDDRDRELIINYGFATLLYLAAAALVTRLPGAKR